MKPKSLFKLIAFILVPTFFAAGCIGEHKRKTEYMARAKTCFINRNYTCAKKALSAVLAIDPDNVEAYANLGETCLHLGDISSAFSALKTAARISPDVIPVQIRLATLYFLKGETKTARKILEKVLARSPKNLNALYLTAEIYFYEKNFSSAAASFKDILSIDPKQERARLSLARIRKNADDTEGAIQILEKGLRLNPDSTAINLELYRIYTKTGRVAKAEKLIADMIKRNPDNPGLYILKGDFLADQNRIPEAEEAFQTAIRISPENPGPYLNSAMFYERIRRPDRAISMYRSALSHQPNNPLILIKLANFYLDQKKIAAAERILAKVRKIQAKNPYATMLEAKILIQRKKYPRAISMLENLISRYPDMSQALYLKAIAHINAGQADAAKTLIVKINKESRFFIPSRILLAGMLLKQRRFSDAIEACTRVLSHFPGNVDALKMLGEIYVASRNYKSAAARFREITRINPKNPEGYYLLGIADELSGKVKLAEKHFKKALDLKPSYMDALARLVSLLARNGNIDAAKKLCDRQIQAGKKDSSMLAVVYQLKGRLLASEKEFSEAERLFKKAIILNPDYLPAYYSLASLYTSEKKTQSAIDHFLVAIDRDAHQEIPHMMLGILYANENRYADAIYHYQKALEIKPDFIPAANDLAYLLAEKGEKLSLALELAKKAKKILPDDPRVADTLGWVYYRMGLYDDALEEFTRGVSKLPNNPTIHFHLGMAYLKTGNKDSARAALKKALRLNAEFPHSDIAKKVLASIERG